MSWVRAWLLLVCLLAAAPVSAGPEQGDAARRAATKRYVEAANQAYRLGRYALALRAYEEAYALSPLPAITFSMAQAQRLAYYQDRDPEHLRRALELYRKYLDEAPTGNRREHATLHLEAIEDLLRDLPTETPKPEVSAPKPAPTEMMVVSGTPGARGRIDGSDFLEVPFERRVTAGKHSVEVEAPGHARGRSEWIAVGGRLVVAQLDLTPLPATLSIAAPSGSRVRVDGRALDAAQVPLAAGEHVVSVSSPGRVPVVRKLSLGPGQRAEVQVERLELTERRIASYWTLGTAGALALSGGVTTLLAISAQARVRDYDAGVGTRTYTDAERQERNHDVDRRDGFRAASIALFSGAAVLGVAGGALYFFDDGEPERPRQAVAPFAAPGAAGAVYETVF